jgi:hypothetical protein
MNIEVGKRYYTIDVNQYLIVKTSYVEITSFGPLRDIHHYQCKYIDQTIDRRFEISETEEERLQKKYGRHSYFNGYGDRECTGKSISATGTYREGIFFDAINEEDILRAVEERRKQNQRALDNELRCPLTGGRLIRLGGDPGVMDGSINWIVEGHEDMRWETGTRWFHDIFSGHGYFKWYGEEREWREQIKICGGWKFVDKPKTPEQEVAVQKIIDDYEESERKRKEEYERKLAAGEIKNLFPNMIQVFAKTIDLDKVEVRPMSAPTGLLNYMDFKTEDEN